MPKIVDQQIEIEVLDVAERIDLAHVRDGWIVEGADHVREGIHIAEIGSEGRLLQRLLADGRDVGVLHPCVDELLRIEEHRQFVEPLIGDDRHAEVGFSRVRGSVGDIGFRQHDEERGFAYLRQAYNSGFHKYDFSVGGMSAARRPAHA